MASIEGSYRYILTGLFIVMKVPEAIIEVDDYSASEVKFNIDMSKVTEENVNDITDLAGIRHDFLATNGFDIQGVDYSKDVVHMDVIC